jgi:hypothetical protein
MTCDAYEHLTRIAVEVKDLDLLPWVAEQLSWQYREQAVVANCTGPGVLPPGWRYPIVVQDGQVAFADFENAEGNQQGVEQFKARYTLDTAKKAAAAQGFEYDESGGQLVIYQPGGVVVTVRGDGSLEINRLDLTDTDPTVYLQEALGQVIENAYAEHHEHVHAEQVLHTGG